MLWGDFKKIVEEQGVTDETGVAYIDYSLMGPPEVHWAKAKDEYEAPPGYCWIIDTF